MKCYLLEYKLKPGNFDKASELIRDFVEKIQNEEGTLLYSPFHYVEENNKFIHVISFENENAEAQHREAEYTKNFIQQIGEISINEPKYTEVNYVNHGE